ncbi:glycoside hydrolase family 3 N-terminal domain-containing protein [Halomicrobium salinisoli]|uniref:glycoside hydrolase family 3 N-terminal domain-containing protein n=1 Tax=Halomicrobium salinisoli TaxID=2878391 RepID=UPI001CF01723|nr:glycoside hydrolase family 3 N-terminal domain-containing protein [Halomicrobium salinisoli]
MDDSPRPYEDPDRPVAERVTDLRERMTLEEKAGQITGMIAGRPETEHDLEDVHEAIRERDVGCVAPFGWLGAVLTEPSEIPESVNELQRIAVEETRLGIPLLFSVDATRGFATVTGATVFPSGLGVGATWDPDLAERAAALTATAVRATGATQTYAPTCDVVRDPRWGRAMECYGESPRLVADIAAARVRGYQHESRSGEGVIATAKHFPAYSEPERGEDAAPVDVSEYTLRNVHVPPFEAAIEAGVRSVMPSYSSINGEPAHASERYLRDMLREELGFEGYTVADWDATNMLVDEQRVATDRADGLRRTRTAGVDVCHKYEPGDIDRLIDLVESGDLPESTLDDAVERVLRAKFEVGLFDDPYVDPDGAREALARDEHVETAREVVRESLTLLENDETLPLSDDADVLVTGVFADFLGDLFGGYSLYDTSEFPDWAAGRSVRAGIEARSAGEVTFESGVEPNEKRDVDAAVAAAADADVAVAVVGEQWYYHEFCTGARAPEEWPHRASLELSTPQREFVEALAETRTPTVVVLVSGRPLAVEGVADVADALVLAYYPGTAGGDAVADVLYGDADPGGRLPVSVPRSVGHLPQHREVRRQGRPIEQAHLDSYDPLYPFGYGLSYASFDYEDLGVTPTEGTASTTFRFDVTVSNTSDRAGTDVVQLYGSQRVSRRVRPVEELVGYERVDLDPGERRTVTVDVPAERLGYYRPGDGYVLEPGRYDVSVGEFERAITVVDE